ncbi:MAG: DUF3828 domain-containing protein [Croceibacterium sp.]
MALTILSALLLATQPAPAPPEQAALLRTVEALFKPYSRPATQRAPAVWQRRIWSRETAALIARWRRTTPSDEVDDLSDGDWLCQCQDWDEHAFKLTVRQPQLDTAGHAAVDVRFQLSPGEWRSARLLLNLEGGAWKLDDVLAADFASGLKATIRRTIADDTRK